ncbi:hypothetical protein MTR_2g070520 [Medicago truncatula]|uniref:Reverse transcriptase zinc-binding domain-containing protein n=1 Tax=Medicago truncatula TaxID=3880 RepID=A0A072V9Z4_MEDTR|nr:hypothetical protein MTR_2g070520 [Medicago truncatula]
MGVYTVFVDIPPDENMRNRGCIMVSDCDLFHKDFESSNHFFLPCNFASALWQWFGEGNTSKKEVVETKVELKI